MCSLCLHGEQTLTGNVDGPASSTPAGPAAASPITHEQRKTYMRGMKRRTKIIIGIVILVIAGLAGAGFVSRRGKDVTAVTMAKVDRLDLTSKVSANGRIDAKRKVDLSANIMGQIASTRPTINSATPIAKTFSAASSTAGSIPSRSSAR